MKSKNLIKIFLLFTVLILSAGYAGGQSLSNFESIVRLIDSSVSKISGSAPSVSEISIEITVPDNYQILKSDILNSFAGKFKSVSDKKSGTGNFIRYDLKNADVNYTNMFRDGFLGSLKVEREISIAGSFLLFDEDVIEKSEGFEFAVKDTVDVDNVALLENPALPFTQSELPEEPFLSGLLEPVVAIGSAAMAVIIFFTVRSK